MTDPFSTPQFFDAEDNFESLITWQYRQLKGDGTYTEWQNISTQATGTKFEYTTAAGGIFQVKAIIVSGGEHVYVRKLDARHADDSNGNVHDFHKIGAEDFVGVSEEGWQLDVRFDALNRLGSTDWRRSGRIYVGDLTWAEEGDDKCNIFIYHKCNRMNAVVPFTRGIVPGFPKNPPLAIDWWNDNSGRQDEGGRTINSVAIPGWHRLPDGTMPQPGFIGSS